MPTRKRPACTAPPLASRYSSFVPRTTTLSSSTLAAGDACRGDRTMGATATASVRLALRRPRSSRAADVLAVAILPPVVAGADRPTVRVDVERVGAQACDLLGEAAVEPLDDGHDGDHRGSTPMTMPRVVRKVRRRSPASAPEGDADALDRAPPRRAGRASRGSSAARAPAPASAQARHLGAGAVGDDLAVR